MVDIHDVKLKLYDIIDINQTVNGRRLFIITSVTPLEISYAYDIKHKYEYDKEDLLKPDRWSGEVDWEIVGKYEGGCLVTDAIKNYKFNNGILQE